MASKYSVKLTKDGNGYKGKRNVNTDPLGRPCLVPFLHHDDVAKMMRSVPIQEVFDRTPNIKSLTVTIVEE